jgi:hypothetical protein
MAKRLSADVKPMKSPTDVGRGGSRPKPPKAVAQRASLEASGPTSDHKKAKRPLTAMTVAFSALLTLWLSMMAAVGLALHPACSRQAT